MGSLKLTFGRLGEELRHISEVPPGLACDCICPGCGAELVARKGDRRRHHFAHRTQDCGGAGESSLHLAAKRLILEAGGLTLPELVLEAGVEPWVIHPGGWIKVDTVQLETSINQIVPDVVISAGGKKLAIEVVVTNPVSADKIDYYRKIPLSLLEIRLHTYPRTFDLEDLKQEVIHGTARKKWIYNVQWEPALAWAKRLSERKPVVYRGSGTHVDDCPIPERVWRGKPYANLYQDCYYCPFCVDVETDDQMQASIVYCTGKTRRTSWRDFLQKKPPQE